ncbi:hypothetical protein JXA47_00630 [Candidatus Sumerlaeota bacterium]|nr:hypothetical protein [Candidatus Sumerlaeota bacterium]
MNTLDLEVFRAGDHGERGEWGEDVLEQMARDYDPSLHEAPVTVDHAQSGPALGWVESLRRVGGALVARLRHLDPGFAELIRLGRYKKRSVELYPALRETGRPYLRAVSFLGACPPAIKGMADVVFAEGEGAPVVVEFDEAEATESDTSAWEALRGRLMSLGRWLPTWEELGLREFWEALGDADRRAWFTEFLESLPEAVPTERLEEAPVLALCGEEGLPTTSKHAEVAPSSVALHRRVTAFRGDHPELSYSEALRAVARGA